MGKLAGYNHNTWELSFPDQAGDDVLAIGRAPFGGATIKGAYAICDTTLAAGTANVVALNLLDGGQTGTVAPLFTRVVVEWVHGKG